MMSGPRATICPIPSCPPTWGSLIFVMGFPSGPAAVPAFVWRSFGVTVVRDRGCVGLEGEGVLTTLADACVEHFGEDFIAAWDWDGIVCFELD